MTDFTTDQTLAIARRVLADPRSDAQRLAWARQVLQQAAEQRRQGAGQLGEAMASA